MKSLLLLITLLGGVSTANAYQMSLEDVVLFEDTMELPVHQSFPCSKYIDVVNCGSHLALERGCKQTLKIQDDKLSCQSLRGDTVVFAEIDRSSRFEDETMRVGYGYKLKYSSRVSLKSYTTPNGNTEYQPHVK